VNQRITETQLQTAILDCAAMLGWLCMHPRPARTKDGWRTAAEGNGAAGYPDLTLARGGFLIFAELKSSAGRVSPKQQRWLDELTAVSVAANRVQAYLWTTEHWLNGTVERVLKDTGRKATTREAA
jgi:hypothetical protein